jgi:hypothetical protein
MEQLAKIFGEIWLDDPIQALELDFRSNLTLTHTWLEPHELSPKPTLGSDYIPQQLPFKLQNSCAAYQAMLPKL